MLKLLKQQLYQECRNEEQFWKGKSRVDWLKHGDKNTKFYHAATKSRRAQNRIRSLLDNIEKEWFAEEDLGRIAEEYFKMLFTSEDIGYKLREMEERQTIISHEQNATLMAPVTPEEVKRATFDINPGKCPGPDGMNGYFFQQFWESIGESLTRMVTEFFRT
ncbi:unnamed protein product [Microthlaspi erraticum]|uniref:Reverse transcriptase domain-containing protein n=1 Tax=Microthlaspi erraticum TaxID=1685480 RepID=A0A6D2L6S9_9BRAS|nr:unnamed protein product [Microthlaspi erraticum]